MNVGIAPAIGNVHSFPSEPDVQPLTWIYRRLLDLGIIDMASSPTKPPQGINLNYSTVLFYMAVIASIAGGFWWAWQQAHQAGYERGKQEAVQVEMQKKIDAQAIELQRQGQVLKLAVNPPEEKK